MLQKYPKKAISKWQRYNSLEKGFIFYCIILFIIVQIVPIIVITDTTGSNPHSTRLFSEPSFLSLYLAILILLLFIIVWNTSFRFKKFFQILTGFKDNEAIVNFGVLFIISMCFLSISNTVGFVNSNITSTIDLDYGYFIIGILLIIGLLWNLVLALNFSKSKKKSQLVNIIQSDKPRHEQKDSTLMGLFDTEKDKK